MERRANYFAVGSFGLLMLAGIFATVLWLARAQLQQEYQLFRTSFIGPVAGLGTGAAVRLNGIDVGRVAALELDDKNPKLVIATLQIRPGFRIRADSETSLESQGLTGLAYVEISGGSQDSPLLSASADQPVPMIRSRRSSIQQLVSNAPEVMARLVVIADRVIALLDDRNIETIGEILQDTRSATAVLSRRGKEIDQMVVDGATTMRQLALLAESLQGTSRDVSGALRRVDRSFEKVDEALASTSDAVKKFGQVAVSLDQVVQNNRNQIRDFSTHGLAQLTQLISESRLLVTSLTRAANELERDPSRFLFGERRRGYTPQ